MAVTVILPAYNEAVALPAVLDALFSVLGANSEVIVVDDGSTDHTASIATT
jgi:glycosyltransferase involved in cell wall biosynthesis